MQPQRAAPACEGVPVANLAFAIAFVALPILTIVLARSITWALGTIIASGALAGLLVSATIDRDLQWNWLGLQLVALVSLAVPFVIAVLARLRDRSFARSAIGLRHQLIAVGIPFLAVLLLLLVSRVAAAPRAGLFTAVGFLVRRTHAEDNAKWLDFTSQAVTGHSIVQSVPMGGALQLYLICVLTVLGAISTLVLGGFNEVLVSSNGVVYGEFLLVALSALALAPLAERRFAAGRGRRPLPAALIWAGALVLITGSLATSGFGHITLQFTMLVTAAWVAAFLVGTPIRGARTCLTIGVIALYVVWFPLTPITVVLLWGGAAWMLIRLVRGQRASWAAMAAWAVMLVLTWSTLMSTLRYMTDSQISAAGASTGGAGGVRTGVVVRALDLLSSQGGTEAVAPVLALIAAVSVVGAAAFLRFQLVGSARAWIRRFGPAALLAAYAVALATLGTWWAGSGPNYGAIKTTFLVTIIVTAACTPLALRALGHTGARSTIVQVAAIAGLVYLLAIDSLLPRALSYASPQQWPSISAEERGHWWPAEVRDVPEQTIASLPIACAYRIDQGKPPSALPDGQAMYACSRILSGLSGADAQGLSLVNWERREWFTDTPAWFEEYPNLALMPDWVRAKDFILLDYNKKVIGLESVQSFMDRYKPDWAQ